MQLPTRVVVHKQTALTNDEQVACKERDSFITATLQNALRVAHALARKNWEEVTRRVKAVYVSLTKAQMGYLFL